MDSHFLPLVSYALPDFTCLQVAIDFDVAHPGRPLNIYNQTYDSQGSTAGSEREYDRPLLFRRVLRWLLSSELAVFSARPPTTGELKVISSSWCSVSPTTYLFPRRLIPGSEARLCLTLFSEDHTSRKELKKWPRNRTSLDTACLSLRRSRRLLSGKPFVDSLFLRTNSGQTSPR